MRCNLLNQPWVYLVLLGLVFVLFSRFLPKSPTSSLPPMMKEIEETMEHFAADIEEDNKELLQSITVLKTSHDNEISRLTNRTEQLEKISYDLSQEVKKLVITTLKQQESLTELLYKALLTQTNAANDGIQNVSQPLALQTEQNITDTKILPMQMKQRYAELFQLHEQGKSVEFVAKKLGLNKGEVSLIIQLAKQEEATHVK
jgi:hypothetical protein